MTDTVNVPREPTEEMLAAVKPWPKHWPKYEDAEVSARVAFDVDRAVIKSQWRDMLAAAPKAEPMGEIVAGLDSVKAALESGGRTIEYFEAQRRIAAYKALRGVEADKMAVKYMDAAISALLAQTEAPKVEQEPVANPLVFGLGALVVDHGKYGGEPAVFVAKAKAAGRVGELTGRDYFDRESLQPGELVLQFPTDTQAKSVADALVGSPAPSSDELLKALEGYVSRFDGEDFQSLDQFLTELRDLIAKHKGPQS